MAADEAISRARRRRISLWATIGIAAVAIVEVDVYRVRGGSMAPLLDGAGADSDVLVAIAHLPALRSPKRFDLIVHDRPSAMRGIAGATEVDGDRCVKRIVALSGERPVIKDGDLYLETTVDGASRLERVRRDPHRIRSMTAVVDAFSGTIETGSRFLLNGGMHLDGRGLRAEHRSSSEFGATRLEYDGLIPDTLFGENGGFDPNGVTVNDTGIEIELLEIAPETRFSIELREQGDLFRIHLGSEDGLRIEYRRGPAPFHTIHEDRSVGTRIAQETTVRALNCDDRILVWIGTEVVCDVEYAPNDEVLGFARNDPAIEVEAGSMLLGSVRILRDVFYLTESPLGRRAGRFDPVPPGGYFVLGDNSRKSIDSRDYGPVDESTLRGAPILRRRVHEGWSGL